MPRNLLLLTSTNTQDLYDVNLAYVPMAISAGVGVIGGFFGMPIANRDFDYQGRRAIIQLMHMLWQHVDLGWQEWFVYQNNYAKDRPNSATIHTRVAAMPHQWMKAIVDDMERGYQFYNSFWDFRCQPVFSIVQNYLNYVDYEPLAQVTFLGVPEWLWPCVVVRGPNAFFVVLDLIRRTQGTDYPVPLAFVGELARLYSRWQPVHRL